MKIKLSWLNLIYCIIEKGPLKSPPSRHEKYIETKSDQCHFHAVFVKSFIEIGSVVCAWLTQRHINKLNSLIFIIVRIKTTKLKLHSYPVVFVSKKAATSTEKPLQLLLGLTTWLQLSAIFSAIYLDCIGAFQKSALRSTLVILNSLVQVCLSMLYSITVSYE